jgi:hypothetical protein
MLAATFTMLAASLSMLAANWTVPIMHFITFEAGYLIGMLCRFRFLANLWHRSFVAVFRIVLIIYVTLEMFRAVIPRAGANEHTVTKPFWAIVAVGRTAIRRVVIVTIRTLRRRPNVDINLSLYFRSGYRETDSSHSSYRKKFASVHKLPSIVLGVFVDLLLGYSLGQKKNKREVDSRDAITKETYPCVILPVGVGRRGGSFR